MPISVDIYAKDIEITPAPIVGAVVSIYDPDTSALVAQATTDGAGRAAFSLPGLAAPGKSYEVRVYKSGVLFSNPWTIQVHEPLVSGTNIFDVAGMLQTLPVATDPRVCRCTGRFVDFRNQPRAGLLVQISSEAEVGFETPKVVDGRMITTTTKDLRTDVNGVITVDLIRGGRYNVCMAWEEEAIWPILVPDRSSASLIELIHPQPVSLDYADADAPGNAVTLSVGQTKTVQVSVLFSDFNTRTKMLSQFVELVVSNGNVDVLFDNSNGVMSLLGREAGSSTITPELVGGLMPSRVPDYSLVAPVLAVTITP